jgi:hypothetical protein
LILIEKKPRNPCSCSSHQTLLAPGRFHGGQDDLQAQVNEIDVGDGDHDIADNHSAFVEDPIQGLAKADVFLFIQSIIRQIAPYFLSFRA